MKKNIIRLLVASASITAVSTIPCFASDWKQAGEKWQYELEDGSLASSRFIQGETGLYYIGDDGYMITDSLVNVGDNYYYLDKNGRVLTNSWKLISDNEGNSYWYYFGDNGRAFKNGSKFYPKKIGDKSYAFNFEGKMLKGYINENGEVIDEKENFFPFMSAKYYFGDDGAMYTSSWLLTNSTLAPDLKSNVGMKDYSNYDKIWIYFGEDGKLIRARNDEKSKIIEIKGKKYAFDENGVMIPSFIKSKNNMPSKYSLAHNDSDGSLIQNRWTWAVPAVDMVKDEEDSKDEFDLLEYSWWRTDENGKLITNGIHTINGRKYAFDKDGRMKAGFVFIRNGRYVDDFDVDQCSREDFLAQGDQDDRGLLPASESSDLYIFNADEFNDGSMMSPGECVINLRDSQEVFGISKSGKVYGNRFRLQKVNNKYYFNGLRLSASSDIGYGIVDIAKGAAREYVVVNSGGNVVRGRNRLIKDNEGYYIIIKNNKFFARVGDEDAPRLRRGRWVHYDSGKKGMARYGEPVKAWNEDGAEDFEDMEGFKIFEYTYAR